MFLKNVKFFSVLWLLLSSSFLFANSSLEKLVEISVKKMVAISTRSLHLNPLEREEIVQKLTQRICSDLFKDLPRGGAAHTLEHSLHPRNIARVIETIDDIPEKEKLIEFFSKTESQFLVARRLIVKEFLGHWEGQEKISFLRGLLEKAKEFRLRGKKLDQEKILEYLLFKGKTPHLWFAELEGQLRKGVMIDAEELVAFSAFLDPVSDMILAEGLDSLFFRRALVLEFWKRRPQDVHAFFDRLSGMILPRPHPELFSPLAVDFPVVAFEALHPDRRSASFIFGFPESYAKDKMAHEARLQLIRLFNIKALENAGLIAGPSYKEGITKLMENAKGGVLRELKNELGFLEAYEKAFKGTMFDIFDSKPLPLEDIFSEEGFKELQRGFKWEWWKQNAKMVLFTSLFCLIDYYFETRPEEIIEPQELDMKNSEMIKIIDLKIELTQIKLQSEKDPHKIQELKEYLESLKEMRKQYQ